MNIDPGVPHGGRGFNFFAHNLFHGDYYLPKCDNKQHLGHLHASAVQLHIHITCAASAPTGGNILTMPGLCVQFSSDYGQHSACLSFFFFLFLARTFDHGELFRTPPPLPTPTTPRAFSVSPTIVMVNVTFRSKPHTPPLRSLNDDASFLRCWERVSLTSPAHLTMPVQPRYRGGGRGKPTGNARSLCCVCV